MYVDDRRVWVLGFNPRNLFQSAVARQSFCKLVALMLSRLKSVEMFSFSEQKTAIGTRHFTLHIRRPGTPSPSFPCNDPGKVFFSHLYIHITNLIKGTVTQNIAISRQKGYDWGIPLHSCSLAHTQNDAVINLQLPCTNLFHRARVFLEHIHYNERNVALNSTWNKVQYSTQSVIYVFGTNWYTRTCANIQLLRNVRWLSLIANIKSHPLPFGNSFEYDGLYSLAEKLPSRYAQTRNAMKGRHRGISGTCA